MARECRLALHSIIHSRSSHSHGTAAAVLAEIVETGPDPKFDGVVRWRRIDLKRVIEERFGVTYSERAISDLLAELAFSYMSGRPQHPRQDERVLETFKMYGPSPVRKHDVMCLKRSASMYPA